VGPFSSRAPIHDPLPRGAARSGPPGAAALPSPWPPRGTRSHTARSRSTDRRRTSAVPRLTFGPRTRTDPRTHRSEGRRPDPSRPRTPSGPPDRCDLAPSEGRGRDSNIHSNCTPRTLPDARCTASGGPTHSRPPAPRLPEPRPETPCGPAPERRSARRTPPDTGIRPEACRTGGPGPDTCNRPGR